MWHWLWNVYMAWPSCSVFGFIMMGEIKVRLCCPGITNAHREWCRNFLRSILLQFLVDCNFWIWLYVWRWANFQLISLSSPLWTVPVLVHGTGVDAHTGWPSECSAEESYNNNWVMSLTVVSFTSCHPPKLIGSHIPSPPKLQQQQETNISSNNRTFYSIQFNSIQLIFCFINEGKRVSIQELFVTVPSP